MAPDRQSKVLTQMAETYVTAGVRTLQVHSTIFAVPKNLTPKIRNFLSSREISIFTCSTMVQRPFQVTTLHRDLTEIAGAKLRVGQLWLRARQYTTALNFYQSG